MKFYRWITLGALFGCSVAGFAQVAKDIRTLDIIIRDFEPNHPDFENFSEESVQHLDEIYNYVSPSGGALMNFYGYGQDWYASYPYHTTCGNENSFNKFGAGVQIGTDGLPKLQNTFLPGYLQQTSTNETLKYGECSDKGRDPVSGKEVTMRGYANARDDVSGYKCPGGRTAWSNEVIYTPGMVNPYLKFTKMVGEKFNMYDGVVIEKLSERCDNQFFNEWYTDVPGRNRRINTTMVIPKDPNSKYYIYDYNYNNGGYSPLDSINPDTREWVMNKPCKLKVQPDTTKCDQFEPQTLSIFCPPYNYQYASSQKDFLGQSTAELCKEWLNQGGPRAVNSFGSGHSAAWQAAVKLYTLGDNIGMKHLRNYAFTMMGYASFKYKAANQVNSLGLPEPEVFEFAGDDDMWIFVDGVLVVDLGGTHLSAPGKVNIQTLAKNNHGCHAGEPLAAYTNCNGSSDATGWADDTWHHLHFFYADRQSDGSNIYIRTSLAELAPSRFGQPTVNDVVVKVDENGNAQNSMFMNVALADSSFIAMNNPNVPSIVVLRNKTVLGANGMPLKTITGQDSIVTMVYGYYVTSMTGPIDKEDAGQMYQFEGVLKDLDGNIVGDGGLLGDDRIAFNVPWSTGLDDDGNGGNYTSSEWQQLMAWSKKFDVSLGGFFVASISGNHVAGFDEREKWGKITYTAVAQTPVIPDDPAYDRPDFTNEAQTLTDLAGSGALPTDMTADLVLTPIPAVIGTDPLKWAKDNADQLMASGAQGATVYAPGTSVVYGAGQGENKTLCYNDGSANIPGKKSNETCTSWSFPTTQPFHVNIRVFDHLGHFVNQYNKRVTKEDFQKALNGLPSTAASPQGTKESSCGDTPIYGSTGAMLATIKMYPVTDKGRLLATGPYIYQMTVVKDAYEYCYKSNGSSPTIMTMPFQRTTETIRRGYRRTKAKK